jgi:hypothetical protein
MFHSHFKSRCLPIALMVIALMGCSNPDKIVSTIPQGTGMAKLMITAATNSPFQKLAKKATIAISASDMLAMTKSLTITDSSVEGTITGIPAGKNRFFVVAVYDSLDTLQYRGSSTANVIADSTVLISINVIRVAGNAIISGNIIDSVGITFDHLTDGGSITNTSLTYLHTCSGDNRILFVGVRGDVTNDLITGVTYNGSAMILADKDLCPGDRYAYLYYLKNPVSGPHNVMVNASASILISAVAVSYDGALQTGGLDAINKVVDGNWDNSLTVSINTTVDNCWVVGMFHSLANATAGSNTILRSDGVSSRPHMCDNNGSNKSAGPVSLSLNWLPAAKRSFGIIASFAPVR